MDVGSSVFFGGLIFHNFFKIFGEGDLEAVLIVFVEAIVLEGIEGDGGLEDVFKVDEAEEVLPAAHGGLLNQPDALEPGEGTKDIYIGLALRLTSRSDASFGTPSTYRELVASLGMWKRAMEVFCCCCCCCGGGYMDCGGGLNCWGGYEGFMGS